MRVERRAFAGARDVTALLTALKVPLTGKGSAEALDAVPRAEQDRLLAARIADPDESDGGHGTKRHLVPGWTVRETWFWNQTFPAGRDLRVEHSYTPGTGGSVGTMLASRQSRAEPEGRGMLADYCIDSAFLAAIDRRAAATGREYPVLPEKRVHYVLTTGANWRAPIGRFRLVVDTGAADNLVSFCGEGVRKISATQFEMVKTNWRPDRNLKVLIVEPAREN